MNESELMEAYRIPAAPFDPVAHKYIVDEATEAAMEFGTSAIEHAKDRFREEGIQCPAEIDRIMFDALMAAGAFRKGGRR